MGNTTSRSADRKRLHGRISTGELRQGRERGTGDRKDSRQPHKGARNIGVDGIRKLALAKHRTTYVVHDTGDRGAKLSKWNGGEERPVYRADGWHEHGSQDAGG